MVFRISDYEDIQNTFRRIDSSTSKLCKGPSSLPVLAVDLQKHCNLLQVDLNIVVYQFISRSTETLQSTPGRFKYISLPV